MAEETKTETKTSKQNPWTVAKRLAEVQKLMSIKSGYLPVDKIQIHIDALEKDIPAKIAELEEAKSALAKIKAEFCDRKEAVKKQKEIDSNFNSMMNSLSADDKLKVMEIVKKVLEK